jgi:hypothetical protein
MDQLPFSRLVKVCNVYLRKTGRFELCTEHDACLTNPAGSEVVCTSEVMLHGPRTGARAWPQTLQTANRAHRVAYAVQHAAEHGVCKRIAWAGHPRGCSD